MLNEVNVIHIGVRGVVPPNGYGFGAPSLLPAPGTPQQPPLCRIPQWGPGPCGRGPGGDPRFRVGHAARGLPHLLKSYLFSLVFHPRANGVKIEVRATFLRGPKITEWILSENPCRIWPGSGPPRRPAAGGRDSKPSISFNERIPLNPPPHTRSEAAGYLPHTPPGPRAVFGCPDPAPLWV